MNLIEKQDHVSAGFHLGDQSFHTLFKLSTVLGTCDQTRQVKRIDSLVFHFLRNHSGCDSLRKAFDDRRLSDTRFSDQARIVLCSAA